jgi:NAD(P)-dependent dehydrogenase (short-subunit alcohol dehydrogenase family)
MSDRRRFEGKKVLVTGSGTGIGRGIALEFAREGADVALHYAHSDAGAKSAAEEIVAMGRRATVIQASFEDVDEVVRLGAEATAFLGGIDCLVNNSGITFNKPFVKITREQYDTVFNVNIRAQFFLTQHVVQHMLNNGGGAVVNLTSIHGVQGAPEHAVYAATKGAIIAFTRTLGVELAHKGIRVNAIAPGWVMVENHRKIFPGYTEEGALEGARNSVPLGRPGFPKDIARLALFLCSEDAEYIVGQTIIADGGTTALMSLISDFRSESSARCGLGYVAGV